MKGEGCGGLWVAGIGAWQGFKIEKHEMMTAIYDSVYLLLS
jgi:hypothetical protein